VKTKICAVLAPVALASTLFGMAGSASAQPVPYGGWDRGGWDRGGWDHDDWHEAGGPGGWMTPRRDAAIRHDIIDLRMAIDRAQGRGQISPRDAWGLRREADAITRHYEWASRNGLSRGEVRRLADRVNAVRMRLHMERAYWGNDRW